MATATTLSADLEQERLRLNHMVVHLQGQLDALTDHASRLQTVADLHTAEQRHMWVPPGHYYSPVPDVDVIAAARRRIYAPSRTDIPGLDLGLARQWASLKVVSAAARDVPFPEHRTPPARYWFDNPSFSWGDATILYGTLQWLRPRRLIEVGSGFSTACILDTIDRHGLDTQVTMVEPYPELVRSLLAPDDLDRVEMFESAVQDVPLDVFRRLEQGDLLFIDSTHVLKTGSDVHFELLEVLPRLVAGVVVHIHDVFPGFEYPFAWTQEGRGWNEAYALRALLVDNPTFEVLLWPVLLFDLEEARATSAVPNLQKNPGGSIWLRRVG